MREVLKTENLQQQLYNQLAGMIMRRELPPGKPLPSTRELARMYQVSSTTVRKVMEQLKREKLIHTRHNRPALAALPERNRKHLRIGVMMYRSPLAAHKDKFTYETGPFGWLLYRSIFLYAKRCNISCTLITPDEREKISSLDGIIGIAGNKDFYNSLESSGKVFVSLMSGDNAGKPGTVLLDRVDAMVKSALYFLSSGAKDFYVVGFQGGNLINQHRLQGFNSTLLEYNVAPERIVDMESSGIDEAAGFEAARRILSGRYELPLAVMLRGDYIARGVIKAFIAGNLEPKKDFFVIGMTDLEESAHWDIPLTVQSCPYEMLGSVAVERLKKFIADGKTGEGIMIKNRLIIRKS